MADSQTIVKALVEVDPGFVELVETLFGKSVDAADVWQFLYTPDGIAKAGPGVAKASPDMADLHVPAAIAKPAKGILVPKTTNAPLPDIRPQVAQTVPPKKQAVPVSTGVGKGEDEVDLVWGGEFAKADTARRQAFGWASIIEVGGRPVIDLQGDVISPDDLEKAAYVYVEKSRVGGDQHARDWDGGPLAAGHLIESMVYTDQKYAELAKAANVPLDTFGEAPRGWWVGFQYPQGSTWDDIQAGRKTGFSIHGKGKRLPMVDEG